MKRLVCILLCVVLTLSLVACGGGQNPDAPNVGGQNPDAPNVGGNDSGSISKPWWKTTGELTMDGENVVFDNVNLSLMTVVNGADYTVLKEIINQFNAEYKGKIRIDVRNTTQEKFVNNVTTAVAQNQNPADILMSHQNALQALATEYQCMDNHPYCMPVRKIWEKSFRP